MRSYYDTMQVCKRWGHQVTSMYDSYSTHRQNFCEKCGSETTHICSFCNTKIRGYYHVSGVIGGSSPDVPLNCHSCGAAYPWKTRLLWKKAGMLAIAPAKYVIDAMVSIFKK
ncbi:MAG: DUF2321 domain-containing protein [Candidatus Moranbacteria bacterium]|nr:DUF2321 domain-containing protein [Candidatus Moranbacteria bacterium]